MAINAVFWTLTSDTDNGMWTDPFATEQEAKDAMVEALMTYFSEDDDKSDAPTDAYDLYEYMQENFVLWQDSYSIESHKLPLTAIKWEVS